MSMHAMRARVVAFERSLEGVQPRVAYGFYMYTECPAERQGIFRSTITKTPHGRRSVQALLNFEVARLRRSNITKCTLQGEDSIKYENGGNNERGETISELIFAGRAAHASCSVIPSSSVQRLRQLTRRSEVPPRGAPASASPRPRPAHVRCHLAARKARCGF